MSFGLAGPLGWFEELNNRMDQAAERLAKARRFFDDPKRDRSDEIDAAARASIRVAVTDYLSEIFEALHAMPLIQQQPHILEALKFIVTEISSLQRGGSPGWLIANPSKQHFKSTTKEAEWVPIIAALELARLKSSVHSVDAAAQLIAKKTSRKIGTIKDWHEKLYNKGKSGFPLDPSRQAAAESIRTIISQMRAVLLVAQGPVARDRLLDTQIDELLTQ